MSPKATETGCGNLESVETVKSKVDWKRKECWKSDELNRQIIEGGGKVMSSAMLFRRNECDQALECVLRIGKKAATGILF